MGRPRAAAEVTPGIHPSKLAPGLALAAVGSIAFSGKAIIVKLAYRHGVDAVTLIMYRMLFALPIFAAMAWWASRGKPPLTRRDWLGVLGLGLTGYYLASFLDFAGLAHISASLERLILYLNPTLVLLLGWLLYRRPVGRRQALGMGISYLGVVLVFGHEVKLDGGDVALGALLVFLSAVSYAIYLSYSGQLVQRLPFFSGALNGDKCEADERQSRRYAIEEIGANGRSPGSVDRRFLYAGKYIDRAIGKPAVADNAMFAACG